MASITAKGVATIVKDSTSQRVNLSRLRNYYRSKSRSIKYSVHNNLEMSIGCMCQMDTCSLLLSHICKSSDPPTERKFLLDHLYTISPWQMDHLYASPGAKWLKELGPLQSSLVSILST